MGGMITRMPLIGAGFLIVKYGYWATFALAGMTRLVSAFIFLISFGGKNAIKPEEESPGLV